MNTLSRDDQTAVLRSLVEGNSMRSTARITGTARNTVSDLLRDVGAHCKNHHDRVVRGLAAKNVQADEVWSYCFKKGRKVKPEERGQGKGDLWTFAAIERDWKLVIAYRVGSRDVATTNAFIDDLHSRLTERCQLTTDALYMYAPAVETSFGAAIDYAHVIKVFGKAPDADDRRYSPPVCIGVEKRPIMGKPDLTDASTSHVERSHLSLRTSQRRYTRLTNGFSKKAAFHLYATALHFTFYNYCRPHGTLTKNSGEPTMRKPTTPAMAAGLADRVWSIGDILNLLHSD